MFLIKPSHHFYIGQTKRYNKNITTQVRTNHYKERYSCWNPIKRDSTLAKQLFTLTLKLSLSLSLSQNPKLGRTLYLSPTTSLNHLFLHRYSSALSFFSLACLIYLFILIYAINYCCIWIFISNFPMLYSVGWENLVQEFLTVLVSNSIYEVVYEYVNSIE